MFSKIKAMFKGKETKAEERKEKANTTPAQYAAIEKREPVKTSATKPAAKPASTQSKPAQRKPVVPAKKPAGKPQAKQAQKRGK